VSAKFEFIDAQKAHYPITKMCEWAQVSTSGFYEWRGRPTSATARWRVHLGRLIEAIFDDSDRTYGYRRIHAALARQGEHCSPEVVRGLMRELDLVPCQPRPWRPTTTLTGDTGAIPDLLNRDFTADAANQRYVGDITYLPLAEGANLYLATVIDCFSRRLAGWAIAEHMRTELIADALTAARDTRGSLAGAVFHSDHAEPCVKPRNRVLACAGGVV